MEAFIAAGGEYQWHVIAQGTDGSEICNSELFTFVKPAYENPRAGGNDNNSDDGDNNPQPAESYR